MFGVGRIKALEIIYVMGAITNSVINGDWWPTQIQVMDRETCFDKLWLEASINSLHKNGLRNYKLNLLYNKHKVAVKVNIKVPVCRAMDLINKKKRC